MVNVVGRDRSVLSLIVSLNTQDQLFNKGIRSDRTQIGEYTDFTISIKRAKGQRYDHITLKDTGDFYDSFAAFVDNSGDIEIETDPVKTDEFGLQTNLIFRYGEKIVGLTPENLDIVRSKILKPVQDYVLRKVF